MANTLGKYELLKKLAVGGMAEVYLAQTAGPMNFSKTLVVKRILPHLSENEEFITMFLNEARLAALLNHANVVQIFDLGKEDGNYYLAMEYIDGPNLRDLNKGALSSGSHVPVDVAVKIISLACEGLAYAHEYVDPNGVPQRLVHRDISPHNVLLSRSGNVKVADFGIAKAASIPSITRTGQIKGKLKYMSPEQLRDEPLDLRADVWAMGVTLYEMLAGSRPFEAPNEAGVILGIATRAPRPLAEHAVEAAEIFQPIIDRALAKKREERYPDARTMQTDLERALITRGAVVRGLEISQAVSRFCPPTSAPSPINSLPQIPAAPRPISTPNLPAVKRPTSLPGMPAVKRSTSLPKMPAVAPGGDVDTDPDAKEKEKLIKAPAEVEFHTHRDAPLGPHLDEERPPPASPGITDPSPAPVLANMALSESGPVLTNMGRGEAGPVLTNMGRPAEKTPTDDSDSAPEESAPSAPVVADSAPVLEPALIDRARTDAVPMKELRDGATSKISPALLAAGARPSVAWWAWMQERPVATGLVIGAVLVSAMVFALVLQYRELRAQAEVESALSGPVYRGPTPIKPEPKSSTVTETPVMAADQHATIISVPDDRKERDPIDEPGAAIIAKAQAEQQSAATGKAPAPIPQRHLGAQIIQYGYLELDVQPPCFIDVDHTPFGTTPISLPLEVGAHSIAVNCAAIDHHEHFNVFMGAGAHQRTKLDLRRPGTSSIAASLARGKPD